MFAETHRDLPAGRQVRLYNYSLINMENIKENSESFRDSLSTVSKEGKRQWIYPKKPSGKFYNARTIVSIILLAILFGTPFIKVNGHPFVLLDVINRNFIIFGIPFGPHDFVLFGLMMITLIVFIFLFTVAFGRVFCGWICPQTIFMEMVFRKIEYWIEGDYRQQMSLNKAPWTAGKILKKTGKQAVFFAISFIISNFFLAYLIGMDQLIKIITDPVSEHINGLIAMLVFSGVFYWVFSSFREQACTMVCPYGRLQGVMLDQDSIVISYDYVRGEPRGKINKNKIQENKGDCVDCHLCVDVCPTGIDIRNGVQLECVNCTACIDACNDVMDKINKPRGLIRFDSLNGIENKKRKFLTPRMIGYSIVLILLIAVQGYMLANRSDFSINILRTPGLLFQEQDNNKVSNIYDVNIVNKTFNNLPIELKLENLRGELKLIGSEMNLKPQEIYDGKILIILPKSEIKKMDTPLTIGFYSNGKLLQTINTSFLGPVEKQNIENKGTEKGEEKNEN
jgi:cytochrome c oxidase accessory protein FixG